MTSERTPSAAEERLLDAGLQQYFRAPKAAVAPEPPRRWLIAALVLLGVAVTATTLWQTRADRSDATQQPEPVPLPPEVTGLGAAAIEMLPADAENLQANLVDPRDLSVVSRFERLRGLRLSAERVRIAGIDTGRHLPRWSRPPADLLAPVAALPRLEVLKLPAVLAVSPALLAPLAGHAALRELQFVGDGIKIGDEFVAALAAIPRLRSLHLAGVPIDAQALQRLAKLRLTSLELEHCSGLDAAGWQAMLAMRELQRLSFTDWAWHTGNPGAGATPPWRPSAADVQGLTGLPNLRCLELRHCHLEDEQLAALPDTLRELRVFGTNLTPEGLDGLRRLGALRELDLDASRSRHTLADLFAPDSEPAAEAFAGALTTLHLQSMCYWGALTPTLAQAIGAQGDLRELAITTKQADPEAAAAMLGRLHPQRLRWRGPLAPELLTAMAASPRLESLELITADMPSLAALAACRTLQHLRLSEESIGDGIAPALLAPLAQCPALREVEVYTTVDRARPHPQLADLQRALGDRIRLLLHQDEVTVKR